MARMCVAAAVAAGMMSVVGIGGAQAATLSIGSSIVHDNGYRGYDFTLDSATHTGTFDSYVTDRNGVTFGREINAVFGSGTVSNITAVITQQGYTFSADFFDPSAKFINTADDIIDPGVSYGPATAHLMLTYDARSGNQILNGLYVDPIVSFDPRAFVPLPASAPLFGAGLIVLAASGWGAKKRRSQLAATG